MRWVLGTNVVLSGAISSGSPPHDVMLASFDPDGPETFVSDAVLEEYERVLHRTGPRLGLTEGDIVFTLAMIRTRWSRVAPEERFDVVESDPDDDKFFDAAVAADADFVVPGDSHVLSVEEFRDVRAIDPSSAIDLIGDSSAKNTYRPDD